MSISHSPSGASTSGAPGVRPGDVAALRRRRATLKASCTRVETFVNNANAETPEDLAHIEERRIRLDVIWSEYDELQSRIEAIDDREASDRVNFEESFYAACARIRLLTRPVLEQRAMRPRSEPGSAESVDSATHIRLPKLNLPSFSGKYDEWFPFCDTFTAIIHNNDALSSVQRFQYLRASLTGEAMNVVRSLEISDRNYDVAWNLLKERYDNKRVVVQAHIGAMLELSAMAKENAVELRRMSDGVSRHVRALNALNRPADSWDDLLIYILNSKLDPVTSREWHASLKGSELPTLKQFLEFIAHRSQILESVEKRAGDASGRVDTRSRRQGNYRRQTVCAAMVRGRCNYCAGEHAIHTCREFAALSIDRRIADARRRGLCLNCLRVTTHAASRCVSGGCKICGLKHNTLLHLRRAEVDAKKDDDESMSGRSSGVPARVAASMHASVEQGDRGVLLSTAMVYVLDGRGSRRACRALLDSGSQASFISSSLLEQLQIKSRPVNVSVLGVNGALSASNRVAEVRLGSRVNSFATRLECVVVDRVTEKIPATTIMRQAFKIPSGLILADPRFNVSADIDILIGADLFWGLLCVGQIEATSEHPTLQKTLLGWIMAGRAVGDAQALGRMNALHVAVKEVDLHERVEKFWRAEEIISLRGTFTIEEQACEAHFLKNVACNEQGKYVVKLPVKEDVLSRVGDSRDIALRRFHSLEKRLRRDPALRILYVEFLREYERLGHMRRISTRNLGEGMAIYLPHHGVVKGEGRNAKLRVVFDASCETSTGVSLNDALMVGPTIQQDLVSILMRFRAFAYAFTADVEKMYRQILIDKSQNRLQRILWRENASAPIDTYELLTVTYGTSSAPFLATRCIQHLARERAAEYPLGSKCALRDFYVDDLLTGADTINEVERIRDEVVKLLRIGHFELRKWSSNCAHVIQGFDTRTRNLNKDAGNKVLGIIWEPVDDEFRFEYNRESGCESITKRTILAEIASLFDPLGLLGPITVVGKIILQDVWQSGVGWDESLPEHMHERWLRLRHQLPSINKLRIPRWVGVGANAQHLQIHGFCDASERAYGACVYIRGGLVRGCRQVRLLTAKSRVAPVRTISIPRLELNSALLLARLIEKVRSSIDLPTVRVVMWTDSMVALQWVSSLARRWTTFVANRVGEIQRLTEGMEWRHVPSADNPADVLSRGVSLSELMEHSMWWTGPSFLGSEEARWPSGEIVEISAETPEQRRIAATVTIIERSAVLELLDRHSSIDKILRIIAYCLRFIRARQVRYEELIVSHHETTAALQVLTRIVQKEGFCVEYRAMSEGRALAESSKILSLAPFFDDDKIIRVGGRLRNSTLPYDARHPMLLPKGRLAELLIEKEHLRNMHAGLRATMCAVRQRFWPLAMRSVTRKILRKCVICFKCKPIALQALMADLPRNRVSPSRPFEFTGVDYAGPISLKEGKRRNAKIHKAYISIFICFSTKAVHIEIVTDLTTDAFLAALKRFISRRGKPTCIYSDNGTTFVGASKRMKEFVQLMNSERSQNAIKELLYSHDISWKFIPPHAPHFGGLWEAAVKSAKFHLYRVVGNANLTLEEAQTVFCEIEAVMNSRPLIPLSEDPNDLSCITPGHFLIGTALNSFPTPDLTREREGRLLRWQHVEQIRQHFWRRWSAEYLHTLMERQKWRTSKGEKCEIGRLVLIQQPGLGPLQWLLGRVEQVHPGADGVVRAATINTARGTLTRPISKLAMLPLETDN